MEQDDYAKYYGHGRLNAGAVMEKVSDPYCVIHSGAPTSAPPPTPGSITTITVTDDNLWENVAPGTYSAQLATVVHVYYFEFDPNAEIVGYWDRESSTIGTYPDPNEVDGRTWADYVFDPIAANIMEVTATTYAWKLIDLDQWFPADPTDLQTAFSLHVFNGDCWEPSAVAVEEIDLEPSLITYPNPASDLLYVELFNAMLATYTIEIADALGRIVIRKTLNSAHRQDPIEIGELAVGTYQVKVYGVDQKAMHSRFIKL